jgi:hypothetical protein
LLSQSWQAHWYYDVEKENFKSIEVIKDYSQIDRVIKARKEPCKK